MISGNYFDVEFFITINPKTLESKEWESVIIDQPDNHAIMTFTCIVINHPFANYLLPKTHYYFHWIHSDDYFDAVFIVNINP